MDPDYFGVLESCIYIISTQVCKATILLGSPFVLYLYYGYTGVYGSRLDNGVAARASPVQGRESM